MPDRRFSYPRLSHLAEATSGSAFWKDKRREKSTKTGRAWPLIRLDVRHMQKTQSVPTLLTSHLTDVAAVPRKWRSYYRALLRAHGERAAEVRQLSAERKKSGVKRKDELDAGADAAEGMVRTGVLASEEATLTEVEAALQRIQDGTYGICESTGRPIPTERLKAVPWTRYTAQAERKVEAEKRSRR
jgi:RNA polymerase-binding transcription factor DksA